MVKPRLAVGDLGKPVSAVTTGLAIGSGDTVELQFCNVAPGTGSQYPSSVISSKKPTYISNLNVHSIKPPIVPQSPPVPLSSHPPSREHRNHVQNWSQSRIGFGLCLIQGPFALSAPSATFSRNRNHQTDSNSVANQVAPSARLPGIVQQRRALSIHEYISADLLNQVRILCASPARSSPSHSDPKKIVWHWRPQRLCREDGRRG